MNYKVYQGSELKQTVTSKTAVMNGLQPNRTYDFSVEADNVLTGADGKTRYLHTAYANSADGKDGFYVGGGTNLLTGTGHHTVTGTGAMVQGYLSNETTDDLLTVFKGLEGQTVTVSVDYEYAGFVAGSSQNRLGWEIQILGDTKPYVGPWYNPNTDSGSGRMSRTFVVPKNITGVGQGFGYIEFSGSGTGTLSHLKLEKGSVATPYSPAPSEAHPTYVGTYTDLTQADSENPLDYTWSPIRDGDATRDGTKETISVTTRGIRFNIPKTLTVGSNVTLRYEEYPLGIVPIGNEPSGMFGGGNKQSLSAKVISTANGSSVVEVGGNVIDVGGKNLLVGTSEGESSGKSYWIGDYQISGGLQPETTYTLSGLGRVDQTAIDNHQFIFIDAYANDWSWNIQLNIDVSLTEKYNKLAFTTPSGKTFHSSVTAYLSHPNGDASKDSISGMAYIRKLKLELGTIATPYASFVDGDTFTAQPDGTFALFSEYKALYY